MTYKVVQNTNYKEFIKSIEINLKHGWSLQGGISVFYMTGNYGDYHYSQAMIK